MMRQEQYKVFRYLEGLASRAFFEDAGTIRPLSELVRLELPAEIMALDDFYKPAALTRLQKIAVAAAAAVKCSGKTTSKPERVQLKLESLDKLLSDEDVRLVLATQLGVVSASTTIEKMRQAIRHVPGGRRDLSEEDWRKIRDMPDDQAEAFITGVRNHNDGTARRPRKLTSIDVGDAVAEVLRDCNLPVNASETGLLARTLETIRAATGFPTNSAKTPAKLNL